MTRISSYNNFMSGTSGILDGQTKMAKAQDQASSQKVASDLKGYGTDAKRLINAKNMSDKLQTRTDELKAIEARASVEATAFTQFTDAVDSLRQSINGALANQNGAGFGPALESALQAAISAANVEFAGQNIFGGTRAYDEPFVNADLNTLAGQVTTDANWIDTGENRAITIDDGRTVELSKSAKEIFRPFIDMVVNIRKWENSNTALTGRLNAAQIAFLQTQSAAIAPIQQVALEDEAKAGILAAEITNIRDMNETKIAAFDNIVGDIQNVDLAEVAARLSAAQTQYQASAAIFSQLKDLNLLMYLR
ncbi:MAG: flagellin [Pseudomonadota bacterium]